MSEQPQMSGQVPVVDYLVLGPAPHLVTRTCESCGARFFDRRNGCARCGGLVFQTAQVATVGTLKTFTIVAVPTPGMPAPYVAGVVDCEGVSVRSTIVNVDPRPEALPRGMFLRLCTRSMGRDDAGIEAVAFAFEPIPANKESA